MSPGVWDLALGDEAGGCGPEGGSSDPVGGVWALGREVA